MYENFLGMMGGAASSACSQAANKGINSKVELKIKLFDMSQYLGIDFDTLMDKFKEEYEALPISANDSTKNLVESVLPMISKMIEELKLKNKDE